MKLLPMTEKEKTTGKRIDKYLSWLEIHIENQERDRVAQKNCKQVIKRKS